MLHWILTAGNTLICFRNYVQLSIESRTQNSHWVLNVRGERIGSYSHRSVDDDSTADESRVGRRAKGTNLIRKRESPLGPWTTHQQPKFGLDILTKSSIGIEMSLYVEIRRCHSTWRCAHISQSVEELWTRQFSNWDFSRILHCLFEHKWNHKTRRSGEVHCCRVAGSIWEECGGGLWLGFHIEPPALNIRELLVLFYTVNLSLEAPNYCLCIQGFSFVNTGKQVHLKHARRHFERNLVKDVHHRSVASRNWLKS